MNRKSTKEDKKNDIMWPVTIRLSQELLDQLDEYTKNDGCSRNYAIVKAVKMFLQVR